MTYTAGIHRISAADYQADPCPEPSLSAGICCELIQRSPLHAYYAHPKLNPNFKREQDSVLDSGSIAHALLLEGGTDRLIVVEADDWRTKAAREQRDAAWAEGKMPVLAAKLDTITAMVKAAKAYVAASELAGIFDNGEPELTLLWQEGKAWCRARPDWWTNDRQIMLDYKSTSGSAEPNAWIRNQLLPSGYDVQASFYRRGAKVLVGALPDFIFLVQENAEPFACSLIGMAPALVDLADRKVEWALTLWKNCIERNEWNGYPSAICHAEPPDYAVRSFEEMMEIAGQG